MKNSLLALTLVLLVAISNICVGQDESSSTYIRSLLEHAEDTPCCGYDYLVTFRTNETNEDDIILCYLSTYLSVMQKEFGPLGESVIKQNLIDNYTGNIKISKKYVRKQFSANTISLRQVDAYTNSKDFQDEIDRLILVYSVAERFNYEYDTLLSLSFTGDYPNLTKFNAEPGTRDQNKYFMVLLSQEEVLFREGHNRSLEIIDKKAFITRMKKYQHK